MEVLILNSNFEAISLVEDFGSLLWTDRYSEYGDFELFTLVTTDLLYFLQPDNYLWVNESNHLMIIEDREIECDVEDGNHLIVTGRSLESILDRRIVWNQTVLTGDFQLAIKKLIDESIISPEIADRKIQNFVFNMSADPIITALTIDTQIARGSNLYDVVKTLCANENVGFKVTLSDSNQFEFLLYAGVDRSYDQTNVPYVVFSPEFENMINSNYKEIRSSLRNIVLVDGEGEGENLKTKTVGTESGLLRREFYTNASDISQTVDGTSMTEEEYLSHLEKKGLEVVAEKGEEKSFEGQIDTLTMFKYGEDFFIGDIIQLSNEYGMEGKARVTEIILSQDSGEMTINPKFTAIEGG